MIGGGHNGLVAGAYLAKAGARAVVLEARHKTGGAAATDHPWPEAPDIGVTQTSAGSLGLEAGEERGPAATVRVA